MWSAFSRLGTYRAAHDRLDLGCVTLTFGKLEEILDRPPPPRARIDPAWWANTSQPGQTASYPWYGWLRVRHKTTYPTARAKSAPCQAQR